MRTVAFLSFSKKNLNSCSSEAQRERSDGGRFDIHRLNVTVTISGRISIDEALNLVKWLCLNRMQMYEGGGGAGS